MRRINLNGDFSVCQFGKTFSPMQHSHMLADGWRGHVGSDAVLAAEIVADAPSFEAAGRHIGQSLKFTVLTPDAVVGPSKYAVLIYRGEGYEFRPVYRKPSVLRMWVKSSKPGLYYGGISSGQATTGFGWSWPSPIVISQPNVWTFVEINLDPCPADNWWLDHRVGYSLYVFLSLATTFYGPVNQWGNTDAGGDGLQTNFCETQGATFQFADVSYGPAGVGSFDPCDYAEELRRAARYVQKSFRPEMRPIVGAGSLTGETYFCGTRMGSGLQIAQTVDLNPMRQPPIVYTFNPVNANSELRNFMRSADCSGTTVDNVTETGFRVYAAGPGNGDVGDTIGFHWLADASLPPAGVPE